LFSFAFIFSVEVITEINFLIPINILNNLRFIFLLIEYLLNLTIFFNIFGGIITHFLKLTSMFFLPKSTRAVNFGKSRLASSSNIRINAILSLMGGLMWEEKWYNIDSYVRCSALFKLDLLKSSIARII
jgi:hypothetical protein